mmetsp:Transcript_9049/g.21607  ORF Transcript_9049/g.21607 Transcript_9049/m.21607 type:complete len:509 (+) Transcript_9049:48-1574(+)
MPDRKAAHPELDQVIKDPANKFCAECGSKNPKWASVNLGVVFCIECSGLHRRMGTHISKVRSLTLDTKWKPHEIECVVKVGNKIGNAFYEARMPSSAKPAPGTPAGPLLEDFMRRKYEKLEWVPRNRTAPGELVAQGKAAATSASSSEERTRERKPRRDSRRRSRRESRKRGSRQDSRRRRQSSSRSDSRPRRPRPVEADRAEQDAVQFGDFAFAAPASEGNGFASFPPPNFSGADFASSPAPGIQNAPSQAVEDKAAILSSNLSALYNGSNQAGQHQGFNSYSDCRPSCGASAASAAHNFAQQSANSQSSAAAMAGMVGMVARGFDQSGAPWQGQPTSSWGAVGVPTTCGDPRQHSPFAAGFPVHQGGLHPVGGFAVSQGDGFQQAGGGFQCPAGVFQQTPGVWQPQGGFQHAHGSQQHLGGSQQFIGNHFQQPGQLNGSQRMSDQFFPAGPGTSSFPSTQWGSAGGGVMPNGSGLCETQSTAGSAQPSSVQTRSVAPGDILTFTGL